MHKTFGVVFVRCIISPENKNLDTRFNVNSSGDILPELILLINSFFFSLSLQNSYFYIVSNYEPVRIL